MKTPPSPPAPVRNSFGAAALFLMLVWNLLLATAPFFVTADAFMEKTLTSRLSPTVARQVLLERSNWLSITPKCEGGKIQEQPETEHGVQGWSITAKDGSHILRTNTVLKSVQNCPDQSCSMEDRVTVTTKEKVRFSFLVGYDFRNGLVRRYARDFQPLDVKAKILKPVIVSQLKGIMEEENQRIGRLMNQEA